MTTITSMNATKPNPLKGWQGMKPGSLLSKRLEHVMLVCFFVLLDQCCKRNITILQYSQAVSQTASMFGSCHCRQTIQFRPCAQHGECQTTSCIYRCLEQFTCPALVLGPSCLRCIRLRHLGRQQEVLPGFFHHPGLVNLFLFVSASTFVPALRWQSRSSGWASPAARQILNRVWWSHVILTYLEACIWWFGRWDSKTSGPIIDQRNAIKIMMFGKTFVDLYRIISQSPTFLSIKHISIFMSPLVNGLLTCR